MPSSLDHTSSNRDSAEAAVLVIRKKPPSHVFSEEAFDIEFTLETKAGSRAKSTDDVKIEASLEQLGKDSATVDTAKLAILEEPRWMPESDENKAGKLRCRISYNGGPPPEREGAAYCIRISGKNESHTVAPVVTQTIHLVNAKIRVFPSSNWSNVFYKDQGGRDKGMEATVEAYDRDGKQLLGRAIPLNLTLYYNVPSGEPVKVIDQTILRTLGTPDWRVQIDKETGCSRIWFRIEDISKNHQNQTFSLQVAADNATIRDIAPDFTPAVSVRSKKIKSQRVSTPSASENVSSPIGTEIDVARSSASTSSADSLLPGVDDNDLGSAIKGVLEWTDAVAHEVYPMQWKLLGYAQNPDGSTDYNKPYHSMANPNPTIARILSTYLASTRDQLGVLRNAFNQISKRKRSYEEALGNKIASSVATVHTPQRTQALHLPPEPYQQQQLPPQRISQPNTPYQHTLSRTQPYLTETTPSWHAVADPSLLQKGNLGGDSKQAAHASLVQTRNSREAEVEYVLAKQFKSASTGTRLGFPAYSNSKEILGFYRESNTNVGTGVFVPIDRHLEDFSPEAIVGGRDIINEAISANDEAVHSLKKWGSIGNLIDQVLAHNWATGSSKL